MSARAIERVAKFLDNLPEAHRESWLMRTRPTTSADDRRWAPLMPSDLRAVLARVEELEARIAAARSYMWLISAGRVDETSNVCAAVTLLDLSTPIDDKLACAVLSPKPRTKRKGRR
jgi:hypothetical protein